MTRTPNVIERPPLKLLKFMVIVVLGHYFVADHRFCMFAAPCRLGDELPYPEVRELFFSSSLFGAAVLDLVEDFPAASEPC